VRREVREELGIVVEIRAASADSRLRGPNFDVAYFIFDSWVGTPVNAAPEEHVAIGWFTAAEVAELTLADAHLLPIVLDALR
jgi:8-oxo-dGTP pyrophosphatase MutT (NUDIX family)